MGSMAIGGTDASTAATELSSVDVLFSQWYLHRDLVRLLFRERWTPQGEYSAVRCAFVSTFCPLTPVGKGSRIVWKPFDVF